MRAMRGVLCGLGLAVATATASTAEDQPVLVELYTSQGCSSCPPADALFERLAARGDVLALALHVDYWDYIGWKDTFASPAYTARQKDYARVVESRTIYTPQMVIGGQDHLVGTREMELAELIERHKDLPERVRLTVIRTGDTLAVTAEPAGALPAEMVVQLVRFMPEATVSIERGENAGETITYINIVTDWREIGRWDGAATLSLSADAAGDDRAAVIVQEPGPGAVVAAALAR